ncbi:transglycosylase domain-containing protein [Phycicoccus flavus]|uniref:Penicillin-binding protein n=1 Tax=Phycicoccus flavus TaxID=2502783 RepID=A0A8T6R2C2_9MICO|nr:transglycosylase domain-containing protein [Phycicoccus flavus]NHA66965.1 penicillin-binding protein [Phycicoccus flavus]
MRRLVHGLAALVVGSLAVGLLLAGLAAPATVALDAATTSGIDAFDDLPARLPADGLLQPTRILDADGHVLATAYGVDRVVVPLSRIAPVMQQAQVAIEDSRFFSHGALDPRSLARAAVATAGGTVEGASTLTMQYVKLVEEENARVRGSAAAERAATTQQGAAGIARKVRQLRQAVALEQRESKQQILAGYLDLAYYGDQAYGVQAAAERYFSLPASRLDLGRAALLAGIVREPSAFDPLQHPRAAQARRDVVLARMAQLGVVTRRQARAARRVPVSALLRPSVPRGTCASSAHPYECTYVLSWLAQDPALGPTPAARRAAVDRGGLTIRTTFRPGLSDTVRRVLESRDPAGDPSGVGSAATVIQPGTGRILALGQTSRFTGSPSTEVDWAADRADGGSTYGFQSGSTAKLFVLATAFAQGIPEDATVDAPAAGPSQPTTFTPSENSDSCTAWNVWQVRNDEPWAGGPISLRQATAQSVNSAFAALTMRVGLCHVVATMDALGMHLGDGSPVPSVPTVALGAATVSPVTLAAAYAAVAAHGVYCTPVPVESVTDAAGHRLPVRGAGCHQAISADVAAQVADILQAPLDDPLGTATGLGLPGRPAAGKTGTTDSHAQTWFAGFTPQLATAVWVGTPTVPFGMTDVTVGGTFYPGVYGSSIAAPDWHDIMTAASQGLPVVPFPTPPGGGTGSDATGATPAPLSG